MEFKCKYCNGTKYKQVSVLVKQCAECGRQIMSEGFFDAGPADPIPEQEVKKAKFTAGKSKNKITLGNGLLEQLMAQPIEVRLIDGEYKLCCGDDVIGTAGEVKASPTTSFTYSASTHSTGEVVSRSYTYEGLSKAFDDFYDDDEYDYGF